MVRRKMVKRRTNTNERKLNGWIERLIEDEIRLSWLHNTTTPSIEVKWSKEVGATDAIMVEADVNIKLHGKVHFQDAASEMNGYNILLQGPEEFTRHLVPPLRMSGDVSLLWLTPHLNAKTLHDLTYAREATDQWIVDLYDNFFSAMEALWLHTKTSSPPDLRQIYVVNRIVERIERLAQGLHITNFQNKVLQINGEDYGSFNELMSVFNKSMSFANAKVRFSCITHSDEHAKNIMVYNKAEGLDPTGWVIIDYTKTRKNSDWLLSVAKMLQWWRCYCVLERAKGDSRRQRLLEINMVEKDNRLIVEYNVEELQKQIPELHRILDKLVMKRVEKIAQAFEEQEWQQRLKWVLFSVIFAAAAQQPEDAKFAVPVMIGESIKYLMGH
jgi:hypothetical protein